MSKARHVALVALLAAGCGPTMLQVRVPQPGAVNFGAARRLSVVETAGRRSAREQLISEIQSQARSAGHWQVADRTEEGISVKVTGRTVSITGMKTPQAPDEVFLKFEVLEWQSAPGTKQVEKTVNVQKTDKQGKPYTEKKTVQQTVATTIGKALLGVTASDARGRALLAETEYQAQGDGENDGLAVASAARNVVAKFLGDVTPRVVAAQIRVDDEDKAQKPIIEVAKAGNFPRAIQEMRGYVAQNPTSPVAHYNLAVFLDASGSYQDALELYTKAAQNSNKAFYSTTKAACAQRLANLEALAN